METKKHSTIFPWFYLLTHLINKIRVQILKSPKNIIFGIIKTNKKKIRENNLPTYLLKVEEEIGVRNVAACVLFNILISLTILCG